MKIWKPLLIVIPVGVGIGLITAQMVEPQATLAPAQPEMSSQNNWRGGAEAASNDFVAQDARRVAQQDRYRPNYDWDEEYVSGEREGIYSYYDDLEAARGDAAGDWMEGDPSSYGANPDRAAAESAARAAERAVDDVSRVAEAASPPPATIRVGPQATLPSPPPPEPRAAEGELPAIW